MKSYHDNGSLVGSILIFLLAMFCSPVTSTAEQPYVSPACWGNVRNFHFPEEPSVRDRITIKKLDRSVKALVDVRYLPSPNGSYRATILGTPIGRTQEVDRAIARTHLTQILVDTVHRELWEVSLQDAKSTTDIRWVNEKWLFFRAWWTKDRGSDVIFDAEAGTLALVEAIRDGTSAFMQFKETCERLGAAEEVCTCSE